MSQVFPEDGGAKAKAVHGYSASVVSRIRSRVSRIPQPKRRRHFSSSSMERTRIVTSGSHFFGQYWCDAVGARNVASSIRAQNQNAVITMEQVYAWDPDLIFITNFTPAEPQDLYRNALSRLEAREGRPGEAGFQDAAWHLPDLYAVRGHAGDAPLAREMRLSDALLRHQYRARGGKLLFKALRDPPVGS